MIDDTPVALAHPSCVGSGGEACWAMDPLIPTDISRQRRVLSSWLAGEVLDARGLVHMVSLEHETGAPNSTSSSAYWHRLQSGPHWIPLAPTALLLPVT